MFAAQAFCDPHGFVGILVEVDYADAALSSLQQAADFPIGTHISVDISHCRSASYGNHEMRQRFVCLCVQADTCYRYPVSSRGMWNGIHFL